MGESKSDFFPPRFFLLIRTIGGVKNSDKKKIDPPSDLLIFFVCLKKKKLNAEILVRACFEKIIPLFFLLEFQIEILIV